MPLCRIRNASWHHSTSSLCSLMTASGSYRLIPKVRSVLLDIMYTVAQRGQVVAGREDGSQGWKQRGGKNWAGIKLPHCRKEYRVLNVLNKILCKSTVSSIDRQQCSSWWCAHWKPCVDCFVKPLKFTSCNFLMISMLSLVIKCF